MHESDGTDPAGPGAGGILASGRGVSASAADASDALGLDTHRAADPAEAEHLRTIRRFVARHAHPFDRRIEVGHLTGSALIVEDAGDRVVLLAHRKLGLWLQPGGHADEGERDGPQVALREAREETGIEGLELHPKAPRPLDVDVHRIPARGPEPEHLHLDLRYLVVAPRGAELRAAADEAHAVRWFAWDELAELELDAGLLRALHKVRDWMGQR